MIDTPPHSIEAEVATLGAVLVVGESVEVCHAEKLQATDFYREAHRHIWRSIERVYAEGKLPDVVTVMEDLHGAGRLDAVGGMFYLSQLSAQVPTVANVEYYARIVHHHATARAALALLSESRHELARDPRAVNAKITALGDRLSGLASQARKKRTRSTRDIWAATVAALEAASERGGMVGEPTGLPPWDRILGGLYPGRQHIVAGRPAMGKSALAAWVALQFCERLKATPWRRVLVISAEMTVEELGQRWASIKTGRSRDALSLSEGAGLALLFKHMPELMAYPLEVVDDDHITPGDIDAACREVMLLAEAEAARARADGHDATAGIDLIVVDYLTRLNPDRERGQRRVEIDDAVQALSSIAKRYDAPMLTLAQLSRAVEQRTDKRPMLSDLRETGTIEQEAYTVSFLYRGDYYEEDGAIPGALEIIVAKNRGGKTGTAHAGVDLATSRFFEGMSDRPEPEPPRRRTPQGPSPERAHRSTKGEVWVVPPKASPTPKEAPPSPPIPSEPNPAHTTLGGKIPPSPF